MVTLDEQRHDAQTNSTDELIAVRDVLRICPVPASTWRGWVLKGTAPKGIKLGPRKTLWKKSEVMAFLASRASA